MASKTLDELLAEGVRGQRVFVRADLNVPLDGGRIGDDTRIRAATGSLRRLLAGGARVILASHLGRPKGERKPELSLAPIAERLGELLERKVAFCPEVVGPLAQAAADALGDGELLLLENVRFEPGETRNDDALAKGFAELADVYVNDAFGTAHRAHASTVGVARLVSRRAAGDLLRAELEHLKVVREPERPLLCLLGGAKVSDKLAVLEALAPHADVLAIGGAMAYTFLAARGEPTGTSLVEPDRLDDARRVEEAAAKAGRKLLLPTDHVVVEKLEPDAPSEIRAQVPEGLMGVDIGPETAATFAAEAAAARTIFWNGPMGVFEMDAFAKGTEAVANAVASSAARSVVGGGDSVAAINRLALGDRIGHLSTGGGASLEFVQGKTLPGVAALED
ncbi:MAG: phosphoglycerate kinase [Deltaproteobacteria bacterium]|nr:phosphoglycerate kinase [Deltaproteobacteria bacterium]MBW2393595.1 phosphoglycerate kinase [Deltaproteobacteria bacterium]